MQTFIALILAALPKAFIAVFSALFTQPFLQEIIKHVLIYLLQKLAKMTTNTIDDDVVTMIVKQLDAPQDAKAN